MSLRSLRKRTLVAGISLLAGILVLPQPASATPSLGESVATAMLAAHPRSLGATAAPLVEPTRSADGSWAFGSATIPAPPDAEGTPVSSIFVARLGRSGWRVELEGTAGFVDLARQAPASVVSADEQQLFTQNYQAAQSIQADTGLGLPWPQGIAWTMGGGPHGNSGESRPYNSSTSTAATAGCSRPGPARCSRAVSAAAARW
jgi:LasA protease